jgi:outer membrane lipoprotein SlyB
LQAYSGHFEKPAQVRKLVASHGETIMIRTVAAASLLALASVFPPQPAAAQDVLGGALLGGAAGAIVGGAATGRAGGAVAGGVIGAALGATIAHSMQPRRGGYYWYQDACWLRRGDGSYVRVSRRNCG